MIVFLTLHLVLDAFTFRYIFKDDHSLLYVVPISPAEHICPPDDSFIDASHFLPTLPYAHQRFCVPAPTNAQILSKLQGLDWRHDW